MSGLTDNSYSVEEQFYSVWESEDWEDWIGALNSFPVPPRDLFLTVDEKLDYIDNLIYSYSEGQEEDDKLTLEDYVLPQAKEFVKAISFQPYMPESIAKRLVREYGQMLFSRSSLPAYLLTHFFTEKYTGKLELSIKACEYAFAPEKLVIPFALTLIGTGQDLLKNKKIPAYRREIIADAYLLENGWDVETLAVTPLSLKQEAIL